VWKKKYIYIQQGYCNSRKFYWMITNVINSCIKRIVTLESEKPIKIYCNCILNINDMMIWVKKSISKATQPYTYNYVLKYWMINCDIMYNKWGLELVLINEIKVIFNCIIQHPSPLFNFQPIHFMGKCKTVRHCVLIS